jgi:hypothetical protein
VYYGKGKIYFPEGEETVFSGGKLKNIVTK